MLKSGSAELNSAGGNSTPLSPEAKSHTETDAARERGLGVCCVTRAGQTCLSLATASPLSEDITIKMPGISAGGTCLPSSAGKPQAVAYRSDPH